MALPEKYMSWIEEFAKGSFSLYSGNTISAFQPLDFFHFYGLWYDLWLERVISAMEKVDAENKSYQDLKDVLPTPSNMRALLQKAIPAYMGSDRSKKELYKRYTNFIARMLTEACPEDPFGISRTPLHLKGELTDIMIATNWLSATPLEAKTTGRLITAAGSLVHGLYNDVVTDFGWDTYGPYENQEKNEQKYTLLIRNFPDLQPEEIWPKELESPVKRIQIFQLYQNVQWAIGFVGCHTLVNEGNPITGLKYYSIVADGKVLSAEEAEKLITELGQKAEKIYLEIRKKDFEQIKQLVMLQECYQLKALFDLANLEWRPTNEMLEAIKNKPLQTGILPQGMMMTDLEEYKKIFHLLEFEKEVLL